MRETLRHARTHSFAVFALAALSFASRTSAVEQPVRFQNTRFEFTLERDGRFEQVIERQWKIQTENGLKHAAQMAFPYSGSLQRFELLDAYTLKPDGRRVNVEKSAVLVRDLPMSIEAPLLTAEKVAVVIFPEVAVNDSLFARVRITQLNPFFPGHFSNLAFVTPHALQDSFSFVVRAPATLPLYIDNQGLDEKRETQGDSTVFTWSGTNQAVESPEPNAVSPIDYSKRVAISTFASYSDFARAHDRLYAEKAVVTPSIQKLADTITADTTDLIDQIEQLCRWVASNVRYVGINLGEGAVVPLAAEDVLEKRYGDCKGHTVLLQALLSAKGIGSTPALVNSGRSFWLPKVPVVPSFNHVITYVPSRELFLDSTASCSSLPRGDQAKSVLLTRTGEIKTTPLTTAVEKVTVRTVDLDIKDDGTIAGLTQIRAKGDRAKAYWQQSQKLSLSDRPRHVAEATSDNRYRGEGTVEFRGSEQMYVRVAYSLRGGLDWPGSGAFEIPVGFRGNEAMQTQIRRGMAMRKRPSVYWPETLVEMYEIRLPEKMAVVSIPKEVQFENASGSYTATYRLDSRVLRVMRRLEDRDVGVWQPELYPAADEFSEVIAKDLRGQVVYTQR